MPRFNDKYVSGRLIVYNPVGQNFQSGRLVSSALQELVDSNRLELVPHSHQEDEQGMGGSTRFREPLTGVYLEYEFCADTEVVDLVAHESVDGAKLKRCADNLKPDLVDFYTE